MVTNASHVAIDSDVILAPHHGADNGSSTDFIRKVSPKIVIFSAGTFFGHPRTATAKRYIANGVATTNMFRTDRGDKRRTGEWEVGSGQGDEAADDDVDVLITKDGKLTVAYRN